MIFFGIATLVTFILAWVWGSRGFFSALIHLVCVLIAGAVAFGLWETLAYLMLDKWGDKKWVLDIAWGVSLGVPFAVVLAILRVTIDKALPFNTDLDGASNLIGGIACGGASGFISCGILLMAVTNLRINSDTLEYKMVDFDTNGSVVKAKGIETIYPRATAWLFSFMSENSMRTQTPMAAWRPDVAYDGALLRTSFDNGVARNTMTPKAFEMVKRYTVGKKAAGKDVKSFLDQSQSVTTFDSEAIGGNDKNHYVEGFVVKFKGGAREIDGTVTVGNPQVQLIVRSPGDTESRTLFPVAVISQAAVAEGDDRVRYWRWSYASPRTYVASVGGGDDPVMAFEFLAPKGWRPLALNIKGIRVDVDSLAPGQDFDDAADRVEAIKRYEIVALPSGAKGYTWKTGDTKGLELLTTAYRVDGKTATTGEANAPIRVTDTLPFGIYMSVDNKGGLNVDESNRILSGEAAFKNNQLKDKGIEAKLQVRRLASDDNSVIVMVDISNSSLIAYSKSKLALEGVGAPKLFDQLGNQYSAIGYVCQDATTTRIKIDAGSPLGSIKDLPDGGPSPSRGDQKFILVYRVTSNVKLKTFNIGANVVAKIEPNIEIKKF